MIWGVVIGTYSSVFIAVPLLVYMSLRRTGLMLGGDEDEDKDGAGAQTPAG